MKYIILAILLLSALLAPHPVRADALSEIRDNFHSLPPQDRIVRLQALLAHANDSDKRVIQSLIADATYEVEKRKYATEMLVLARNRIASIPRKDESPFIRESIQLDALSIIQAIPLVWLSAEGQRQAMELVAKLEDDLNPSQGRNATLPHDSDVRNAQEPPLLASSAASGSIDEAITIVNTALERAKSENLQMIAEAKPNKLLNECLQECESARDALMALTPDTAGTSRARWEAAMVHLGNAVTLLRERQRLKYTLWAEGRYRECAPPKVSHKLKEEEALGLYKYLSEVDVSLVAEPSLSREITQRLFELYDSIESLKSKEQVRYDAIRNLEKRKTLDDF